MADTYRPPDGYVTMTGATQKLQISIVTLRKLVRDREIQIFRDPRNGRVSLLRIEDLDRLTEPEPLGKDAARVDLAA